jgi:putative hydrolase of the HAD superfamily
MPGDRREAGQTLLIDADDTLWENNIYFDRVIVAFCDMMAARGLDAATVRRTLTTIERERTKTNGYGVKNFRGSLRLACAQLLDAADVRAELDGIDALCAGLARQEPVLLDGVADTLQALGRRHRLILFTKGDPEDQLRKLDRSGLGPFLHGYGVADEKDVVAYRAMIDRHGIQHDRGWMVGNSPRSDILPALEAGLGAIFIPHPGTWELELADLPEQELPRLLRLQRFADLLDHF